MINIPLSYDPLLPLISCIMPTACRASYVANAICMFQAQDYPNKELIIVYNKPSDIPAINYPSNIIPIQAKTTIIGGKRNEACRFAAGAIIAQWDDDDIYNTHRLTEQALPILEGRAHVTGLRNFIYYYATTGRGYLPLNAVHHELYVHNVHSGSLVYLKDVWTHLSMYPNLSLGEDAGFLQRIVKRGAHLLDLDGFESFLYVRHTGNTCSINNTGSGNWPGWRAMDIPLWAQPYVPFYNQLAKQKTIILPSKNTKGTEDHC